MQQEPSHSPLERRVLVLRGADTETFLQGLATNDVTGLEAGTAVFAALLSPQGKILHAFFVLRTREGFIIDAPGAPACELAKRLGLYRLRAKVEIAESDGGGMAFSDPRHEGLGARVAGAAPDDAFEQRRIALGVPEGGKDYAFGTLFPHEAMFDQLNGVSFTKGCYVGQEIVARMQHRGTARSRFLMVTGPAPLPPMGTEVVAGATPLGTMGSSIGTQGLALIRLDRLSAAYAAKQRVTAGGVAITLAKPPYAQFDVPTP